MKHKLWVISVWISVYMEMESIYFAFTYGLALMADAILMSIGSD